MVMHLNQGRRPPRWHFVQMIGNRDLQLDNPRFSGAGKASAVNEYDGVRMDEDGDFARRCTVPEPLLNETQSRSHLGLSLQLSNINSIEVLANVVFGISAAERHISTPWCRPS